MALLKVYRRKKGTIALYKGRRIKHAGQYWPVIQLDRFFFTRIFGKVSSSIIIRELIVERCSPFQIKCSDRKKLLTRRRRHVAGRSFEIKWNRHDQMGTARIESLSPFSFFSLSLLSYFICIMLYLVVEVVHVLSILTSRGHLSRGSVIIGQASKRDQGRRKKGPACTRERLLRCSFL